MCIQKPQLVSRSSFLLLLKRVPISISFVMWHTFSDASSSKFCWFKIPGVTIHGFAFLFFMFSLLEHFLWEDLRKKANSYRQACHPYYIMVPLIHSLLYFCMTILEKVQGRVCRAHNRPFPFSIFKRNCFSFAETSAFYPRIMQKGRRKANR